MPRTNHRQKIGTVEVLRARIYPNKHGEDVAVPPGTYPVFKEGERIYFQLRGRKSTYSPPTTDRIGKGLFVVTPGHDVMSDKQTTVRTRSWTSEQFAEFLRQPTCMEGHPDQRLRVVLQERSAA